MKHRVHCDFETILELEDVMTLKVLVFVVVVFDLVTRFLLHGKQTNERCRCCSCCCCMEKEPLEVVRLKSLEDLTGGRIADTSSVPTKALPGRLWHLISQKRSFKEIWV